MSKDPSEKSGEVNGEKRSEQVAAEQAPETAERTNPVGEATQRESKDPYAEGKHIANPEPNNGAGEKDSDKDPTERDPEDVAVEERTEQTVADQEARDARANSPD